MVLAALFVLVGAHPSGAGPDVSAGPSLTIDAPSSYSAGTLFPVSGALYAAVGLHYVEASRGLPDQQIDILVDDRLAATTTTNDEGTYVIDLLFDAAPPTTRSIRAVAFRGTPLETSSRAVATSIDRTLLELAVEPATLALQQGEAVALTARGTFSDGRDETVTEWATWTSSDPDVATVSDAAGSRGVVTAIAPGSATVTAALEDRQATAEVTIGT